MRKARFLVAFLLAFAASLTAWRAIDGSQLYERTLLPVAGAVGPLVHGWVLTDLDGEGQPRWRYGVDHVDLRIQFDALAVGLVPFLALVLATPGLAAQRRAGVIATGIAASLAIDVAIIVLFPLLVHHANAATDILGTYIGLIGFVGKPTILWFVLTLREQRRWLPRFTQI